MLNSFNGKKIMVVVAHPDDELLGLGATLHRLVNEFECKIHVVILGEGLTSRADKRDENLWQEALKVHRSNIHQAKNCIGYQTVSIYDFPDNRFDSVALLDIIKVVEKEKELFKPEIIFTHHGGDVNIDHRKTFEAVITACRPMSTENVHTIVCFETPSGTEWRASVDPKHFIPNLYIEIFESGMDAKIKGMESYEYEKRLYPHPRSPDALKIQAQRWGIAVGKPMAEAFMVVRSIQ